MSKLLRAIYTTHSINVLATSFVGIFVPIYLLSIDYTLIEICRYYLISAVCIGLSFFIASTVARYIGIRKTVIAGFPFLFAYLGCLYLLPQGEIPLMLLGILSGLQIAFYWYPIQVLFGETTSSEKVGSEVSKLFAFPQLLSVLGPVIGGFITASFGFGALFLFVGFVYLLSLIPLLSMEDAKRAPEMRISKVIGLFRQNKKYALLQMLDSFKGEAEGVFWPLFLYISFENILSIGLVGTFLGIGSAILTLIVGKYSDSKGGVIFLRAGALAMGIIWLLRLAITDELLLYGLSVLAGFFSALITVPFNARVYRLAKTGSVGEFLVFRELILMGSRLILFSLAIAILLAAPTQLFPVLFLLAAFSSILLLSF